MTASALIIDAEEVDGTILTAKPLLGTVHNLSVEIRTELAPLLSKNPEGIPAYSQEQIAKEAGIAASTLSKVLSGTYNGDIAAVEGALAVWLSRRELQIGTSHKLFPTEVSIAMEATFKMAMATNDFAVITGAGGIGKSMGCALFAQKQGRSCLAVTLYKWSGRANGIARALRDALVKRRLKKDQSLMEDLIRRLQGSQRLIVIDGAERLSEGGLHFLIDLHKRTGCPVVLVGRDDVSDLLTPEMGLIGITKRVGLFDEDKFRRTVKELVRQIAPDWATELSERAVSAAIKKGHTIGFLPKQLALMREFFNRSKGDVNVLFDQTATQLHCCRITESRP